MSTTAARPLMVDLCCGLGGASRPARDRGWRVVTLDIAAAVSPSMVGDLARIPLRPSRAPDLLWISPPCQTFSRWRLPWFGKQTPDITLMLAAAAAIEHIRPRSWVIENVPAAITWVEPFLGPPTSRIWGHAFWSDLWPLLPQVGPHKGKIPGHTKTTHWRRSLIPYEVATAFVMAAELRFATTSASTGPWCTSA